MLWENNTINVRARFGLAGLFLLVLSAAMPCRAGFFQGSQSVAAAGMGGAFVAKADDASAIFVNPAGLLQLERSEAALMYGKPFLGLPGVNLHKEYLALGIPYRPELAFGVGGNIFGASGLLSEYEGTLAGAYKLNEYVALGANASYLRRSYDIADDPLIANDPAFQNGKSKSALSVGVGAMLFPHEKVNLGISARHVNKPDMGLITEDPVPMELRMGGMFKMKRASILADVNIRDYGDKMLKDWTSLWSLGGEWMATERLNDLIGGGESSLAVRGGVNDNQFTFGFGVYFQNIRIDYAFALTQDLMEDNSGTHEIAFAYKFGGSSGGYSRKEDVSYEKPKKKVDEPKAEPKKKNKQNKEDFLWYTP